MTVRDIGKIMNPHANQQTQSCPGGSAPQRNCTDPCQPDLIDRRWHGQDFTLGITAREKRLVQVENRNA